MQEIRFNNGTSHVDKEHSLPNGLGDTHDLSAVYGHSNRLWITCNRGQCVMQYDKTSEQLVDDFPERDCIAQGVYHKGIGNFQNGSIAYLYPNRKLVASKYHTDACCLTDRIFWVENRMVSTRISPTGCF